MLDMFSKGRSASAHVIVLGNEKGGSGKSTVASHVAVGLLKAGHRVATIDLDAELYALHKQSSCMGSPYRARSRSASPLLHRARPGDADR